MIRDIALQSTRRSGTREPTFSLTQRRGNGLVGHSDGVVGRCVGIVWCRWHIDSNLIFGPLPDQNVIEPFDMRPAREPIEIVRIAMSVAGTREARQVAWVRRTNEIAQQVIHAKKYRGLNRIGLRLGAQEVTGDMAFKVHRRRGRESKPSQHGDKGRCAEMLHPKFEGFPGDQMADARTSHAPCGRVLPIAGRRRVRPFGIEDKTWRATIDQFVDDELGQLRGLRSLRTGDDIDAFEERCLDKKIRTRERFAEPEWMPGVWNAAS